MSTWVGVRIAAGVICASGGAALLLGSALPVVGAAAIESSVGRSGVVSESLGTLRSAPADRAVVADGVTARLVVPGVHPWVEQGLALAGTSPRELADQWGSTVLVATPATDTPTFLGVGTVEEVNSYLEGTPYSVAVRDAGEWPIVSVPGTRVPAPPEEAGIWGTAATGTAPELPASALSGSTLVLMRADAQAGPEAALRLEYRVPGAESALESLAVGAAAASVGGALLILLGGWLVVGRRRAAEAPA